MILLLLLSVTGFAEAPTIYKGNLVKGEPWRLKADVPRRGEFCLELPLKVKKKPWLVNGLYVELEGEVPQGEKCLAVKTMLPATYDPARTVIQKAIRR